MRTTLIVTVAGGVNLHALGEPLRRFLRSDFLLSLMFQPVAFAGQGGRTFTPQDPLARVTIPDVVAALAAAGAVGIATQVRHPDQPQVTQRQVNLHTPDAQRTRWLF